MIENAVDESSLGGLCDALSWANLQVYDLENRKWSRRRAGEATDREINEWDEASRSWCERRSVYKRRIDELVQARLGAASRGAERGAAVTQPPFQVLPVSLLIDMLTIENIKVHDLGKKGNAAGVELASVRKAALRVQIDRSLDAIARSGVYDLLGEARTFEPK